jgi:NAD(P)-dependent dehydrogenase (short-subunit alcohol dehydrogenase family)
MSETVLITGCRSGFGLGTAVAAARAGFSVYAGLRDLATADDLERAAVGLDVTPLQLDVTRADQRDAAVARILDERGRLDHLVNNAGVAVGGFLEQLEEDELRRVFEVNVFGAWAMTKACLPALRRGGGGSVVMVSSMSGRMALPTLGAYAGSKFALEGLGEAWRHELKPFGIRVVLLEPGAYRTDIFERNRNVCRRFDDPQGPYQPWVRAGDRLHRKIVERLAGDPAEVCDHIVRCLRDPHPALRQPIGPLARPRATLRNLLPFAAVELIMERILSWAREA